MTYQPKVYREQGGDTMVVASGGKVLVESGATLEAEAGSILTGFPTADVTELTLADGKVIVGDAEGAGSAVSLSGDATIDNTGELTIAAEAVTLAKMADLARGSIISGQTENNRPTALDASADGQILVGDGTDLASVAVSGDATLAKDGELTITDEAITPAKCAAGVVLAVAGSATTAEVNAGKTVVAAAAGVTYKIVNFFLQAKGGAASGATSVDLADTDGAVFAAVPAGSLTENAVAGMSDAEITNINSALAEGKGIQLANAGEALATASSINYVIEYMKV